MISKLKSLNKSQDHKARQEPTSESESFTDGTFTLSSLSSPEYCSRDSVGEEIDLMPQSDDDLTDLEFSENVVRYTY